MKFRKILYEKLPFITYIYRGLKYKKYLQGVDENERLDNSAENECFLNSYGEKNNDKYFYVICRKPPGAGFFSNFLTILGQLCIAEKFNFIPVVDMQHFKGLYNEDTLINGRKNAWEYYFEQVSHYSLEEVYESKNVLISKGMYPNKELKRYRLDLSPKEIPSQYLMDLFSKYIKIRKEIVTEIDNFFEERFNKTKVLGIHARGTDIKQGNYKEHPIAISIEEYILSAKKMINEIGYKYIFLATDEEEYLKKFKDEFGDKLISLIAYRSIDGEAIHTNRGNISGHKYRLGLEVLKGAIVLSKCDGLLASNSNVAIFARLLNNAKYDKVNIIDKGKVN